MDSRIRGKNTAEALARVCGKDAEYQQGADDNQRRRNVS